MIQRSILLFLFLSTTLPIIRSFAINSFNTDPLYRRVQRSGSATIPNLIEINSELSEWPLNENIFVRNDLSIGQCDIRDERVYTDDILVENSGPSMLNGTIEIYIKPPINITCVVVEDQITDGTGGIPTYNSGGTGYNWIFIDVKCKYGKGFHFKFHIYGIPDGAQKNTS